MAQEVSKSPRPSRGFQFVSLREERLEHKLTMAFGFMSFIPLLLVVWAKVAGTDLNLVIFLVATSALLGYFLIAKPMVRGIIAIADRVSSLSREHAGQAADVAESNEIGELARAFNRITGELQEKIEELESSRELVKKLLSRIGTAIVSYEGIDNLLSLIMENTASALEAQMGSLLLVDGEKQELFVKATWTTNGQGTDKSFRLKLEEGMPGWVMKEKRPLRSMGEPSSVGLTAGDTQHERPILSVPLQLREQPIGVLSVLRKNIAQPFTEHDESLMASIASQIAVAIENYRLNLDVERTYVETIMALALAVEAKDPYSAGHSKRVGYYAMKIGERMGLDEDALRMLNAAGVLHDIGKIGIKDEILLKPSSLTEDEKRIMQQHSVIGEAILKPVHSLKKVSELVRCHHERFGGGGYPNDLKGEEIPLEARILTVADAYDSIVTDRPYRQRLPLDAAKTELREGAGSQFDPDIVDVFLKILAEKELRQDAAASDRSPS